MIENLALKFSRRRESRHIELPGVNEIAKRIRNDAGSQIGTEFLELKNQFDEDIGRLTYNVAYGGPDFGNSHWYKYDVVRTANENGKFANFLEEHYFVKATISTDTERFIFVVSAHHVGRELSGIMEATAFAKVEAANNDVENGDNTKQFIICSVEPFVFTYRTSYDSVVDTFRRWLDGCLAVGLKEFGDRL